MNIWVVSGDNMLFRIARNKLPSIKPELGLFIRSISNAKGSLISDYPILVFESDDNTVYFDPVAPGYLKQNSTQYQYIVDKVMKDWSKWEYNNNNNPDDKTREIYPSCKG